MPISIVVEDGSGKSDSNAYISVDDVRVYASNRGITLPADDDAVSAQLIQATDYLESLACEYQGEIANYTQSLQWPRKYVRIGNNEIASNVIPKQLIAAQGQLVMAIQNGIVLQPNTTAEDYIIQETIGPITTKYADPTEVGVGPTLTAANSLLQPLMSGGCCVGSLTTIRV